jgi:hypothetical protein
MPLHVRQVAGACHALPNPSSESEGEWPEIMSKMGPNAKLDAAQSKEVLNYILAARTAK